MSGSDFQERSSGEIDYKILFAFMIVLDSYLFRSCVMHIIKGGLFVCFLGKQFGI